MVTLKASSSKGGRPPAERVGEVERRILDAAQRVFLERGFEGASIDEIALRARAGKPTIYAKHQGKAALFAAVIAREVARNTQFEDLAPEGRSLLAKLTCLGIELIERALSGKTVELMRAAIAGGQRFPDLSRDVNEMARKRTAANVAELLAQLVRAEGIEPTGAFSVDRITETAGIFLDVVLFSMLMRWLMGEDIRALKKETPGHVRRRVEFFLRACG
jgi:AcrR family transcriptional regulator